MRYANGVRLPEDLGRLTPFAVPVIFCADFLHRFSGPAVDSGVCGGGCFGGGGALFAGSVLCVCSWRVFSVSERTLRVG